MTPVLAVDHVEILSRLTWAEWVVVGISALAAVWVIWKSVVLTLHPEGEDDPSHVKWIIFQDDERPSGVGPR